MTGPRRFGLVAAAAATLTATLGGVQVAPPGFIRWSAAELARRDGSLATRIGPDDSARETLADYGAPTGAHRVRLIRRDGDGAPEQHVHIEDVVVIRSGAATLVVGGALIDRVGRAGEYTGAGIEGGWRYRVGAGDVLHIPADTPHRYLVSNGEHVTYLLVRLPALVDPVAPDDAPRLELEPPGFIIWSAAELQRRRAGLSQQVQPDRSARETLADFGSPTRSHRFRHIYRDADGVPEIHDDIIDVVFLTGGRGAIQVGGEMLDRRGSVGRGIAGGVRHPVAAGDMLHIPARTPHGYLVPDGGDLSYVLVRVPASVRP